MKANHTSWMILAACLSATSLLASCGGKRTTTVEQTNVSVGQELQDLEKARSDGLVTEKEYQEQRKAILERSKK